MISDQRYKALRILKDNPTIMMTEFGERMWGKSVGEEARRSAAMSFLGNLRRAGLITDGQRREPWQPTPILLTDAALTAMAAYQIAQMVETLPFEQKKDNS